MVKIEKFGYEDFDRLISWVASLEDLIQFSGSIFQFPLTRQQLDGYIAVNNRLAFRVIYIPTNNVIGHGEISILSESTCLLCRLLIGEKNLRGQGLGQEMVKQLLGVAFNELGATKAELNVYDWNLSAIRCYEKEGFLINHDKCYKIEVNSQIWTALNMTLERSNWMK
jgi:RimJ/RimL family protein N-acetyltransferase